MTPENESRTAEVAPGVLTRPSRPSRIPPHPVWSLAEQWVWQQICTGAVAVFTDPDGNGLDPSEATGWDDTHMVSATFLNTVLLQAPYRDALPHQGVRIVGAWFKEALALEGARLEHPLYLGYTRFDEDVQLSYLKSTHNVSLQDSYFGRSLTVSHAQIGGQLILSGARCTGPLDMGGLKVEGGLFMNTSDGHMAQFAEVKRVGTNIRCYRRAQFAEVSLRLAKIGGHLELQRAYCTGPLNLGSLEVAGHVLLEDAKFDKISLIFGRIVGSLYLVRSDVSSLDLTGASIQGEFSVGESDEHRPRWAKDAQLVLRNATVGALQSPPSLEAWPALELGGCTYKQLGGLSLATRRKEMAAYLPNWFVNWLKKDRIFSPHPYHQLANVLRSMGHAETADAVLYAGKERERRAAGWRKLKWWGMGLLRLTIGYGYGYKYFRSLLWALGITCIGAIILATTPAGREVSPLHTHTAVENTGILGVLGRYQLASNLAYSFDLLLPIVELDKRHSLEGIFGWQRYYFYLHELLGYVLGSFIVAGLAGLTKK